MAKSESERIKALNRLLLTIIVVAIGGMLISFFVGYYMNGDKKFDSLSAYVKELQADLAKAKAACPDALPATAANLLPVPDPLDRRSDAGITRPWGPMAIKIGTVKNIAVAKAEFAKMQPALKACDPRGALVLNTCIMRTPQVPEYDDHDMPEIVWSFKTMEKVNEIAALIDCLNRQPAVKSRGKRAEMAIVDDYAGNCLVEPKQ
jgi:hypothetical protein